MKYQPIKYALIFTLILIVAGCGESAPVQTPTQSVKKPVAVQESTPAPEVVEDKQEVQEYLYNPIGKRDPFESPLRIIIEVAPDSGVPLTPLQKFDLGQLRLIGVIIGKGNPRAMVIAPDGKSFILSVGTKVGKNEGSVVDITTDAVLVKEKYQDFTGEIKTGIQEIRLPKQGGVK